MTRDYRITDAVSISPDELTFRFSRSSGKGGQNVNKVSTRVEASFDVLGSPSLQEFERTLLLSRLRSRIDASGVLTVSSDTSRSQWQNRSEAVEKLCELLRRALIPDTPQGCHPPFASLQSQAPGRQGEAGGHESGSGVRPHRGTGGRSKDVLSMPHLMACHA